AIPAILAPGDRRGLAAEAQAGRVDRFGGGIRLAGEAQRHAILAPVRRDLVQPEQDMPRAGVERARQVCGGRSIRRDEKLRAGAAAPAAKTVGQEVSAALVKDADVDGVAA